ncbi:putative Unc104-like kinesin [Trypanosoma grayi]|uniref:putative Unc104-like kinesin n=1 Tax=Trypanosoma grayi TaxID=71804 RepID=UPI0004F40E82|nr:putative Unc104-like kinesin [Trypanosoma grayi]KEG15460.1 putative Unc104-like kinesin [Trypanosoma grayi]
MSVRVVVRCRPLSDDERHDKTRVIVRMNDNEVQVVGSLEGHSGKFYYDEALWSAQVVVEGSKNPHVPQEAVYKPVAFELINHVLTGYNGCIFAYGQTGSGKTYSMIGTPEDPGVIPRIATNIFRETKSLADNGVESCVEVSFFEIYNEKVRCLLCPADGDFDNSSLRVREHPKFGPFVEGLTKFVVSSEVEFLRLMRDGNQVRTAAATSMNAVSSRSHAVFAVTLTQKRTNGRLVTTKTSRLNLVDLAGSERLSKTMATGRRLVEGANINKSLACLGNVISSLAEEQEMGKSRHIPYRDSVLTWILKDNLGGNSKTVMLATISPSSAQYEETMSTLRYAERAKKIVNKAVVNESNNNEVIAALQKEIEELKLQLQGASESERIKLSEDLAASEAIQKELQMSLEEKLAETRRVMEERETYMRHLEEQLETQRGEIENLRNENAEKERRIEELLQHIEEVQKRLGGRGNAEVEQLLEQVAALESEQHAATEKCAPSSSYVSQDIDDVLLRPEHLGNVRPQELEDSRVTVRALAKAFEAIGSDPLVVKRTAATDEVLHFDPVAMHVRAFEKRAAGDQHPPDAPTEEEDLLDALLGLEDDPEQQQQQRGDDANENDDVDLELDLDVEEDEDVVLDEDGMDMDLDLELDLEDEGAVDQAGGQENGADEAASEELELGDDNDEYGEASSQADSLEIDDGMEVEVYEEAFAGDADDSPKVPKEVNEGFTSSDMVDDTSAPVPTSTASVATATDGVTHNAGFLSPFPTITTLVVPSHALPNNRYLCELFRVIKMSDMMLIGTKKERIWLVDFFRRRFANLDMSGYISFEYPSGNLYRVEKDPVNSRRLTLHFFEAPHPYELEFTSSDRRQRFYEVAMTLRRNSIMWCPSLCLENENDTILNVQGTTVDRPNAKQVKVNGETKLMVARMPYEVIDLWYGCFSMKSRALPHSAAVLGSFLPRNSHEVYIIGVMDVPHAFIGNDELSRFFLEYLGVSLYYVLANTTVHSKKKNTNNAIIIIVRRSFILRASHIEAVETTPVYRDDIAKGDFTAVGCALRINETTLGLILVNAKLSRCSTLARAGCLRLLMSSFPFGDISVDVGVRFDYFIVSGAFNFGTDFKSDDMLLAQMKAANLMSDMEEATPSAAILNAPESIRIFYAVRPHVCRLDIKQYTSSRALTMPNAFVSADVFCQRAFLSVFGEQVPCVQLVLDKLALISPNGRIPPVYSPELRISADWIDGSPLHAPFAKSSDSYTLSGRAVPVVAPTVSNMEFLRLQTISFSLLGFLDTSKKKQKTVIASGALPLKNMFEMGKAVEFDVSLYYRACRVGTLRGSLLMVLYERNTTDLAGLRSERDVVVVSCYENQVLDGKNWVPTIFSQHHAYSFSLSDATMECSRESFELPDPAKWMWLDQWRHDVLQYDAEGWTYATGFHQPFQYKCMKSCGVRRRRWTRAMQASDPLTLHNYLMLLKSNGQASQAD